MKSERIAHCCPKCGSDVYGGFRWTPEEWAAYRTFVRTPVCPGCATLLAVGPNDLECRLPTEVETLRAYVACQEIEAIQLEILRKLGARARRVM